MTKKHFIALADALRHCAEPPSTRLLDCLASFCASTNPRFNRERWLDYINGQCGPNGGKVKTL